MKYLFAYLFISIICFLSCQTEKKTDNVVAPSDSIDIDPSSDTAEIEDAHFFSEQRRQFIASYKEKIKIDTTIITKQKDTIRVHLDYYCLLDSAVTIPEKFVLEGGKYPFITHNFAADILVKKNDKIVFSEKITKPFFEKLLDENLIKYGVLLYPVLNGYDLNKNNLVIGFSVSIPVTDLGIAAHLVFNTDTGEVQKVDYYEMNVGNY